MFFWYFLFRNGEPWLLMTQFSSNYIFRKQYSVVHLRKMTFELDLVNVCLWRQKFNVCDHDKKFQFLLRNSLLTYRWILCNMERIQHSPNYSDGFLVLVVHQYMPTSISLIVNYGAINFCGLQPLCLGFSSSRINYYHI